MNEFELMEWRNNMRGNTSHKKKEKGTVSINSALHTYIVYSLSQRRISQTLAAKFCGCSVQFLNAVIQGKKKSMEIQHRLATDVLGLKSWDELEWKAIRFQEYLTPPPGFELKGEKNAVV